MCSIGNLRSSRTTPVAARRGRPFSTPNFSKRRDIWSEATVGHPFDRLQGAPLPMIVMKFGGTSVQDAKAIDRAAQIVQGRLGDHPVVVVSAMSKVTDSLL